MMLSKYMCIIFWHLCGQQAPSMQVIEGKPLNFGALWEPHLVYKAYNF